MMRVCFTDLDLPCRVVGFARRNDPGACCEPAPWPRWHWHYPIEKTGHAPALTCIGRVLVPAHCRCARTSCRPHRASPSCLPRRWRHESNPLLTTTACARWESGILLEAASSRDDTAHRTVCL